MLSRSNLTQLIWHKWLRQPYRLHVTDHGGSGPVIILLHGLASSSENWQPLIPLLRQHYRCITIDLVGFGQSPKPAWYGYSIEDHISCLHYTMRGLHLRQNYTLLGHSLGSLLATRYASQYPRHINRLVLLSPPVYAPPDSIASRRARQMTSMYLRAYRFLRNNPRFTAANFQKLARIIPILRPLDVTTKTWTPLVRSLEQCIENQTIITDIAHIDVPTDIFYGIFDEVVVPYNVRQLGSIRDVTLHPLKVDHPVGKRYAAAVAKVLTTQ